MWKGGESAGKPHLKRGGGTVPSWCIKVNLANPMPYISWSLSMFNDLNSGDVCSLYLEWVIACTPTKIDSFCYQWWNNSRSRSDWSCLERTSNRDAATRAISHEAQGNTWQDKTMTKILELDKQWHSLSDGDRTWTIYIDDCSDLLINESSYSIT